MSDAGAAEGNAEDMDFAAEKGFSMTGYEMAFGELGDTDYSYDLEFGREKGISTPNYDLGLADPGASSELRGLLTGAEGVEPEKPMPGPEAQEVKAEVKEETEERPVITRARRRRSLLTEDEGGTLRRPAVYKRSILGR